MLPYLLSLGAGLVVGAAYGCVGVKSPAPPIIALVGLLGILAGEMAVSHWRGQPVSLGRLLHRKSFAHDDAEPPRRPPA